MRPRQSMMTITSITCWITPPHVLLVFTIYLSTYFAFRFSTQRPPLLRYSCLPSQNEIVLVRKKETYFVNFRKKKCVASASSIVVTLTIICRKVNKVVLIFQAKESLWHRIWPCTWPKLMDNGNASRASPTSGTRPTSDDTSSPVTCPRSYAIDATFAIGVLRLLMPLESIN